MKDWIKLHGADEVDVAFRVSEVKAVYPVGEHTAIDVGEKLYFVTGTVDKVLDLISEAEGKKSLYEELKRAREECADRFELGEAECSGCSFKGSWQCLIHTDALPCQLKLNLIPEEYR